MLVIPSTHLVIISYDDCSGRILAQYNKIARKPQISLIIGHDLTELKTLVDYFLPKPAIDRASMRMSELLRQRYTSDTQYVSSENTPSNDKKEDNE